MKTLKSSKTDLLSRTSKLYFSLLVVCLPISFAGAKISPQQGNFTARIDDEKLPQNSLPISKSPNSQPGYQLWRERITFPKGEKNNKSKNELEQMIRQLRSVQFQPLQDDVEPVIVIEPAPTVEPNEPAAPIKIFEEPRHEQIPLQLPYEPVSSQTLQIINNLSKNNSQFHNPFDLGEILFHSNQLKEAALCYRQGLNSLNENYSDTDKSWFLLQLGNCLRDSDLPSAAEAYKQLITEHADPLWVELATVQNKLIEWYQQDKPKTLIDQYRPEAIFSTGKGAPSSE